MLCGHQGPEGSGVAGHAFDTWPLGFVFLWLIKELRVARFPLKVNRGCIFRNTSLASLVYSYTSCGGKKIRSSAEGLPHAFCQAAVRNLYR